MSQVEDLYDETEMLEEIDPNELIIDDGKQEENEDGTKKKKKQKSQA